MAKAVGKEGTETLLMNVPADLKVRWKAMAKERGMTMTAFQVWVMTQVLSGGTGEVEVGLPERVESAGSGKLTVSLRASEAEAVRRAARQEGHTLAGWIAMLIRARLKQTPSFTADEVRALLAASTQLMAIGRNINTAVRRLHAEGKWTSHNQPMLAALDAVKELQRRVDDLQAAAERRSAF